MSTMRQIRIDSANRVLKTFTKNTKIRWENRRGVVVRWSLFNGQTFDRKWITQGQDFYPTWYRKWGHGGTASTALSQLVRWVQDRPVLPIESWDYWSTEKIKLLPVDAVSILRQSGYPLQCHCVLCGTDLVGRSIDWWSLDGVSGPCCYSNSECRKASHGSSKEF